MRQTLNYTWTKEEKDLKKWDSFLKSDPRGHSQQVSHYLKSFAKYPFFNHEFLIVRNHQGSIIAGIGVLIIGIPYFKIIVVPNGPIISEGNEFAFDDIIISVLEKARQIKACYCQIKAPIIEKYDRFYKKYALSNIRKDSLFFLGNKREMLSLVSGTKGFNSVRIVHNQIDKPYNILWKCFSKSTKRNIKKAYSNDMELRYAKTYVEVKKAYDIIIQVSKYQNYKVRPWSKMKSFLMDMIDNDLCIIPCCYSGNEMLGALIEFDVGCRLNYVYGGVLRKSKDLKVGHFLHNEMLKYSIEKGYEIYDLGVVGGEGVHRFKSGFGAEELEFENSREWILQTFIKSF